MSTTQIIEMRSRGALKKRGYPVKAATKILQNQHIEVSTGVARPWPATPGLGYVSGGIAAESADNTNGGGGDLWVEAEAGEFLFPLDDFTASEAGDLAFGVDEESCSSSNDAGTLSACGRVVEVVLTSDPRVLMGERSGVWVRVGDPADAVHKLPIKIVKTIAHGDLDAAATTQSIDLGSVLPAGARLLFADAGEGTFTAFSGGAVSACTIKLGTSDDDDAIATATDVFTGATGFPKTGTAGALGFRGAPLGGKQLQAKFTTTDDNVVNLSAGTIDITIEVDFPGT